MIVIVIPRGGLLDWLVWGWRRSPVRRASETGDLNYPGAFIAISGFYYYYYDASGWGLTGSFGITIMRGLFPLSLAFPLSYFLFLSYLLLVVVVGGSCG